MVKQNGNSQLMNIAKEYKIISHEGAWRFEY